jgi:hypothetical protein
MKALLTILMSSQLDRDTGWSIGSEHVLELWLSTPSSMVVIVTVLPSGFGLLVTLAYARQLSRPMPPHFLLDRLTMMNPTASRA